MTDETNKELSPEEKARLAQLKKDHLIILDLWDLRKKYIDVKDTEDKEYWEALLKDVGEVSNKHNTQFARDLFIDLVSDFERIAKAGGSNFGKQ